MLGVPFGFMRGGEPVPPIFDINFDDGDALPAGGVFSRSTAATVSDFDGIFQTAKSGELRFKGLRRGANTFAVASDFNDFDNWNLNALGSGVTPTVTASFGNLTIRGVSYPTSRLECDLQGGTGNGDRSYIFISTAASFGGPCSVFMRSNNASAQIVYLSNQLFGTVSVPGDSVWRRYSNVESTPNTRSEIRLGASGQAIPDSSDVVDVEVCFAQIEQGMPSDATVLPSEPIANDVEHNAKAVGVEYFITENGNSVDGDGIVTEAAGSTIAEATREGALREPESTSSSLHNRDLTDVVWVSSGGASTVAQDATGANGFVLTASTMTADAANAILLQTVTIASASFIFQPFIRRKTGTGTVEITIDGGSTFIDVTSQLNSSTYTQVVTSQTLVNPSVGFRIVTSGDEIEVDFAGLHNGTVPTTPIETTSSAVTRNADVLTMPFAIAAPWTMFQDCVPQTTVDVALHALIGYVNVNDKAQIVRAATSYDGELDDGTDNPSANVTDAAASYTMGDRLKVALSSINGTEVTMGFNGSSDGSAAGGGAVNTSGFATMGLGGLQTGGPDIPITIRQAQFLSVSRTTGQLETLTTI